MGIDANAMLFWGLVSKGSHQLDLFDLGQELKAATGCQLKEAGSYADCYHVLAVHVFEASELQPKRITLPAITKADEAKLRAGAAWLVEALTKAAAEAEPKSDDEDDDGREGFEALRDEVRGWTKAKARPGWHVAGYLSE